MRRYRKRYDVIRRYQERFVDKMLSYTLDYGNVLYCMNNETTSDPKWGQFWMTFIRDRAAQEGTTVFCTDMFTFAADLGANPARNAEFRRVVREAVRKIGSPRLVHLDGRRLLRSIPGLSVDLVHPSPRGMEEIAYRFSRIILRKIRSEPA